VRRLEADLGLGLHQELLLALVDLQDRGRAVVPKAGEELAAHPPRRPAVTRALLYLGQGEQKATVCVGIGHVGGN